MKLSHLMIAGVLLSPAAYISAQDGQTEQTQQLTSEEQDIVDALKSAIASAATPEAKAKALSEAVSQNPALATQFESAAKSAGIPDNLISSAIAIGLSNVATPAAGNNPNSQSPGRQISQQARNQQRPGSVRNFTPPSISNNSGGGGGGTASGG
jgi:hypothetical protein